MRSRLGGRRCQQVDRLRAVDRQPGRPRRPLTHGHQAPATVQIDRLLRDPPWHTNPLEVGWAIITPYRGLGIATEVGRAALAMARHEPTASRVISFTERHNIASRGVMEKLGMNFVGEIYARGL